MEVPWQSIIEATDNFSPDRLLGEGGCGQVYKGVLPRGGGVVAIKLWASQEGEAEGSTRQFHNEVATLRRYVHPRVSTLRGHATEREGPRRRVLIFSLAEGGSLDVVLLDRAVRFLWHDRLQVVHDALLGLRHLHSGDAAATAFHRDFKSANILLTREWRGVLTDFGLVKRVAGGGEGRGAQPSSYAQSGWGAGPVGTRAYMCPIYAAEGRFCSAAEMYSVGVVLFEVLLGRLAASSPAHPLTLMEVVARGEGAQRLADPRGLWPDEAAAQVYSLARDCTALDRRRRPSLDEVIRRLQAILRRGVGEEQLNCIVCLDKLDGEASACLTCTKGHVVCGDCLGGLILALEPGQLRRDEGCIRCPARDHGVRCESEPWSTIALAGVVGPQVMNHLDEQRRALHAQAGVSRLADRLSALTTSAAHACMCRAAVRGRRHPDRRWRRGMQRRRRSSLRTGSTRRSGTSSAPTRTAATSRIPHLMPVRP